MSGVSSAVLQSHFSSTGLVPRHPPRHERSRGRTPSPWANEAVPTGGGDPEGTLGYCTGAQEAVSTKHRKKMGSSVAYKTRGTFLSQNMRREDACGQSTEQAEDSGCAAVYHRPSLCYSRWIHLLINH